MPKGSRPAPAWSTDAGRSLESPAETTPAPSSSPPSPPSAPGRERSRKFTALLDAETDGRYGRLLEEVRTEVGPIATREDKDTGRVRSGYDVSRADLLRALLVVAEGNSNVRCEVYAQVREHHNRRDSTT
jgi:hypothetical protein